MEGKRPRGKHLTPKMAEFVDLYMLHGSATKAIELGSYKTDHPHRHGQRLLQHPTIREEIMKRQAARSKKFEVTAEYLVEELTGILTKSKEDNNHTAALRAIELMGKTIALWKDRQEVTGADGEAIKHEQLIKENAADFTSRISGLAKRAGTSNVVEFPNGSGASGS
jgi:phage terminase small subunit